MCELKYAGNLCTSLHLLIQVQTLYQTLQRGSLKWLFNIHTFWSWKHLYCGMKFCRWKETSKKSYWLYMNFSEHLKMSTLNQYFFQVMKYWFRVLIFKCSEKYFITWSPKAKGGYYMLHIYVEITKERLL